MPSTKLIDGGQGISERKLFKLIAHAFWCTPCMRWYLCIEVHSNVRQRTFKRSAIG